VHAELRVFLASLRDAPRCRSPMRRHAQGLERSFFQTGKGAGLGETVARCGARTDDLRADARLRCRACLTAPAPTSLPGRASHPASRATWCG